MNSRRLTISLICILILFSRFATGTTFHNYNNENLNSIASQYYGAAWKSVYILIKNSIDNESKIATGTRLSIPACYTYKIRRGDSVAEIAKRHLGDHERYKALMSENNIRNPNDLKIGTELLMPFHLRHKVIAGDTWAKISQKYYRTTKKANLIKDYNPNIKTLLTGSKIIVPIFDNATLMASKRHFATHNANENKSKNDETIDNSINSLSNSKNLLNDTIEIYKNGEFAKARSNLEDLLANKKLLISDRATVARYLGFCAVAENDDKAAFDYLLTSFELEPNYRLDSVTTSPKILAIFQEVLDSKNLANNDD
ncbi:MAG: LysM peptidoglycan-binding domain-containing protein [Deltaproteobacteria bacterium]|nr:LysM peptidoglycan-binding domain-containing protein [Deltaproteobacteria bacterium]